MRKIGNQGAIESNFPLGLIKWDLNLLYQRAIRIIDPSNNKISRKTYFSIHFSDEDVS